MYPAHPVKGFDPLTPPAVARAARPIERVTRVAYLCWPNGLSLHNVGRSLVGPMAERGVAVEVVDSRAWFARPTPADVAFLAHTDFFWPNFPYRRYVRALVAAVHDPDEVSAFGDRLSWHDEPMRHKPELARFDRVVTGSQEMADVLGARYGVRAYHAATFPHHAPAIAAAVTAQPRRAAGGPVRFVSTAYGPGRASFGEVLGRLARPRVWARDASGRFSARQLRGAFVRAHRKNVAWLARLGQALGADPRAAVDFRYGPGAGHLVEDAYLARLAAADVYVCTSCMEGGPLPVMEAVLAGLAVITTPVGQTAEWVVDGESGFVCRTYAEAARAARRYVEEPGLLAAHRARARAVAAGKRFDADGWAAFLRGDR